MDKQKDSNYKLATENSEGRYACSHCGSKNKEHIKTESNVPVEYKTDKDIERVKTNDSMFSWTNDMKCLNCNELFSMENGC